jgi:hypothetical protein
MKVGFLGLVLILSLVLAIVWYVSLIRVRVDLRPMKVSGFRGGGLGGASISGAGRGGVLTTSATATAAQTNPALLTWM